MKEKLTKAVLIAGFALSGCSLYGDRVPTPPPIGLEPPKATLTAEEMTVLLEELLVPVATSIQMRFQDGK